ncbi:alpha-N-acetylgalactosaminide alpha-2,6-sialyltransferase 2 isoform X1 [Astyanax mexicanus]|uniref:alpha-N-acetylgalactosaminide alpha-2,6-sialyltransferase n=1 Tax=Astyanax mexicanus TaxID=7994 RepID=A0A3B1IFX9_ASTMX|nr:alpha-N-acetylgalactosaminide alpha-2,6-sialyltransferase 2 isoform X1 [Astyanax mexicanus]
METRKHICIVLLGLFCLSLTLTSLLFREPQRPIPAHLQPHYISRYVEGGREVADSTEGAAQPRPPCSLRRIVKHHEHLRRCFNFSVPLVQWAGSLNQSEWQQLQFTPLPFGWKDLAFDVVKSTLSLLNHTSSSRLFERRSSDQCVRCAVVGNGGILKGSGQGKAIDSHEYVFRMNGAITKNFEEDVGTKTSFYGFTTNTLKNSLKAYQSDGFTAVPRDPGICYIFIPSNIRDYVMLAAAIQGVTVPSGYDKGDWPSKYFGYKPPVEQFRMIHPSFIEYVTKRFLNSPLLSMVYGDVYMPSTGALMLITALHACDQVSAYGFITRNFEDFSDHYYDPVKKPLLFYANHDLPMEGELWEDLHSSKVLWLYQRDSHQNQSLTD